VRLFDRAMSPGDSRDPTDLVVFNAGNNQRIDFRELTAQQFEDFWRIGCFGGFLVDREAAKRLAPLGRGTVIFTGAAWMSRRLGLLNVWWLTCFGQFLGSGRYILSLDTE